MPEAVGALSACKFALTIDNGVLHLACAAGVPVIGLYREGIDRLWRPPNCSVTAIIPNPSMPVSSIAVEAVRDAIEELI